MRQNSDLVSLAIVNRMGKGQRGEKGMCRAVGRSIDQRNLGDVKRGRSSRGRASQQSLSCSVVRRSVAQARHLHADHLHICTTDASRRAEPVGESFGAQLKESNAVDGCEMSCGGCRTRRCTADR